MAVAALDERQNTMKLFIMHVARAFYDTPYVVVLDQLARHEVLTDDELAGRVGLNRKDLAKLTAKLINDGLVTVSRPNTSQTAETLSRITSKGYYYIDHSSFCNVVKWRISGMLRRIDSRLRNELGRLGYRCPRCYKNFEPLDAMHLHRPGGEGLYCDQCHGELVDNRDEEDVAGDEHRMQRFNAQTQRIQEGLRRTEEMIMPRVDILDWIKKHPTVIPDADGDGPNGDGGLAIAGAKEGVRQEQEYEVVLTAEETPDAERLARVKAQIARKDMNQLPAWHTHSTVTGHMPAFGTNNKDSLASVATDVEEEERKAKLQVHHQESKDAINMYYANLDVQERTSQAQRPVDPDATALTSNTLLSVPPSIIHSAPSLKRKLTDDTPDTSNKHSRSTSYQSSPDSSVVPPSSQAPDDVVVMVGGVGMPFSVVTEDHHKDMSPEEYEDWFAIYVSRQTEGMGSDG